MISDGTPCFSIPASGVASELGNEKVANMVILGYFVKMTSVVSMDSVIKSIRANMPSSHEDLNITAFLRGYGH